MSKPAKKSLKPLADRLNDLAKLGHTGPKAHRQLVAEGYKVSERSVGRALAKIKGPQRVSRRVPVAPAQADPPAAPAGIPTDAEIEGASLETLAQWLELAGRSARNAEARGDQPGVATFGRLAATLFEAIRKSTPKDPPPEGVFVTLEAMRAKGARCATNFGALLGDLFRESESWPQCLACGQPICPKE